jgi:HPt (histidine-containing phosphotransfer) domain-containing protein
MMVAQRNSLRGQASMLNAVSKLLSRLKADRAAGPAALPAAGDDAIAAVEVVFEAAKACEPEAAMPPVFDAAKLDDLRTVMDQAKFSSLVGQFAQSLDERVRRLQALLEGSNWPDAAREAHDIVSVAGNVGAARLSSLARNIEISCKARNEAGCRSLSTVFTNEAADALRALKVYQAAA